MNLFLIKKIFYCAILQTVFTYHLEVTSAEKLREIKKYFTTPLDSVITMKITF